MPGAHDGRPPASRPLDEYRAGSGMAQLGITNMRSKLKCKNRKSESGMSLIELMIASVVLIFGMLSIMGLLMLAMGNNGRSKIDSGATMLSQVVLEQVSAKLAGSFPVFRERRGGKDQDRHQFQVGLGSQPRQNIVLYDGPHPTRAEEDPIARHQGDFDDVW